uniref:Uncharacterized protein n=1 Tax=Lepeophtheirus salmonis TaxID=72036 RepID=A0A0K2V2X0_LEPSM
MLQFEEVIFSTMTLSSCIFFFFLSNCGDNQSRNERK